MTDAPAYLQQFPVELTTLEEHGGDSLAEEFRAYSDLQAEQAANFIGVKLGYPEVSVQRVFYDAMTEAIVATDSGLSQDVIPLGLIAFKYPVLGDPDEARAKLAEAGL